MEIIILMFVGFQVFFFAYHCLFTFTGMENVVSFKILTNKVLGHRVNNQKGRIS